MFGGHYLSVDFTCTRQHDRVTEAFSNVSKPKRLDTPFGTQDGDARLPSIPLATSAAATKKRESQFESGM